MSRWNRTTGRAVRASSVLSKLPRRGAAHGTPHRVNIRRDRCTWRSSVDQRGGCRANCAIEPTKEDLGNRISEALRPYEQASTARVDLTEVLDAEWSRALIVCRGADTADLTEALGFDWPAPPMVDSPGSNPQCCSCKKTRSSDTSAPGKMMLS